jgi:alkylation response protein AidB-like acyl-CoA dehydrogenase
MDFDLSDDQKMLRDQAQRFLSSAVAYDGLRGRIASGGGIDADLWANVAELGWHAVAIPEAYGGLGLGTLDQCVIAEEIGKSVAPIPYVQSTALIGDLILRAASEEQKLTWLPLLASGEAIGTFAFFEGGGAPDEATMGGLLSRVRGGRLSGDKWPVMDADEATFFLVAARDEAGGVGLYRVEADADGIARTALHGFDELRVGWKLKLADVPCVRLGDGDARAILTAAFDRAAVVTAFEQLGGAQACLEMARDYALERRAFGRQIGSYQAIKHKLADMLVKIELARSNAYHAGWAADESLGELGLAAAATRLTASDAYEFAARENMQIHGGISFTWEANCHFHYRRSRLLALGLGGAGYWSRRTIDGLLASGAQH